MAASRPPSLTAADASPSGPVLSLDGLTVVYRPPGESPCTVLRQVALSLGAGEAVGLGGASGSGKTTLLRALLGLLPPTASVLGGRLALHPSASPGTPTAKPPLIADLTQPGQVAAWRGTHLSMIAQEPERALHPLLSAVDQVVEVLRAHRSWPAGFLRRRARTLLRDVGLNDAELADAFPHQLSGGQRQRLVIAQAIACRPSVLLADEPTAALDPIARRRLVSLLDDLRRRHSMALLWISHDEALLRRATDRQWELRAGRLSTRHPAPARRHGARRHGVTTLATAEPDRR